MAPKKTSQQVVDKKEESSNDAYFGLAKSLKQRLKDCCKEAGAQKKEEIIYLWICVNAEGLKRGFCQNQDINLHPMQEWLNVVDEAASLGANWLILSVADTLGKCDAIWPISKWAQQVHGMTVGIHLKNDESLSESEITLIRQLDAKKTRVLLRQESEKNIRTLKKRGITVWTANPQPDGEVPNCQGPTRMIYVNEKGVLYTCGLVEGNEAYRMGHIADTRLKNIIGDPETPRLVHNDIHVVAPGCDGCPALIANFFF